MKKIKLIDIASFIGISPAFLCEVRKGKKSFSKVKSKEISEATGLPLDQLLYTNGEKLYRAIRHAYSILVEEKK